MAAAVDGLAALGYAEATLWVLDSNDRACSCRPRALHTEEVANMTDLLPWWQRRHELLAVATALPLLAVILRWARRRRV